MVVPPSTQDTETVINFVPASSVPTLDMSFVVLSRFTVARVTVRVKIPTVLGVVDKIQVPPENVG